DVYQRPGEERCGGRERPSIRADAVEAVLAAVYLDGGIVQARRLVQRFILDNMSQVVPAVQDFKTALQELVQRRSGQVLTYHLLSQSGPDHAKTFEMEVRLNGKPVGAGKGRSKKDAEQAAAHAALKVLGQ
ncbi:MAG: putative dsRNA-binding protein, partial [Clostridiales bacterium]|nr:putative dsRNA-binding protein [Clostridiales bacterium]